MLLCADRCALIGISHRETDVVLLGEKEDSKFLKKEPAPRRHMVEGVLLFGLLLSHFLTVFIFSNFIIK